MGQDRRREAVPPVAPPRAAKAGFESLVVVCAKCAARQGLGKGDVRRRLKRAFGREADGAKVRVVTAGCLGPCPKGRIAVATPASIARRRVRLLDPALPSAEVRGLLPDLGLDAGEGR